MDEKDAKQEVTCPQCYAYIEVNIDNELYICPVCNRSFTEEDITDFEIAD